MASVLKSKRFHYFLGWAVSFALIAWIIVVVDWRVVVRELVHVNYLILVPLTLLIWLHFVCRALRWRHLIENGSELTFRDLMDAFMLGNFATFILPLRAGEFIRPYVLAKWTNRPFLGVFVSIVIERFFDLCFILLCFGIMAVVIPELPRWAIIGARSLGALAVGILLFMVLGSFYTHKMLKIAMAAFKPLPKKIQDKASRFFGDFLSGTKVLRGEGNLFYAVAYTLIVWFLGFMYFQLGAWMFGVAVSYWVGLVVGVIVALAVAAPSAPGFLGVFQTGCIAGLALFGVSKETALAYSLVLHAHNLLFIYLYGIWVLFNRKMHFSALREAT